MDPLKTMMDRSDHGTSSRNGASPSTRSGGIGRWMGRGRNGSKNGSKNFETDDTSVTSSTTGGGGSWRQRKQQQQQNPKQQQPQQQNKQQLPQGSSGSSGETWLENTATTTDDSASVTTEDQSQSCSWGLRASPRRNKKQKDQHQQQQDADSDGDAPYTMEDILSVSAGTAATMSPKTPTKQQFGRPSSKLTNKQGESSSSSLPICDLSLGMASSNNNNNRRTNKDEDEKGVSISSIEVSVPRRDSGSNDETEAEEDDQEDGEVMEKYEVTEAKRSKDLTENSEGNDEDSITPESLSVGMQRPDSTNCSAKNIVKKNEGLNQQQQTSGSALGGVENANDSLEEDEEMDLLATTPERKSGNSATTDQPKERENPREAPPAMMDVSQLKKKENIVAHRRASPPRSRARESKDSEEEESPRARRRKEGEEKQNPRARRRHSDEYAHSSAASSDTEDDRDIVMPHAITPEHSPRRAGGGSSPDWSPPDQGSTSSSRMRSSSSTQRRMPHVPFSGRSDSPYRSRSDDEEEIVRHESSHQPRLREPREFSSGGALGMDVPSPNSRQKSTRVSFADDRDRYPSSRPDPYYSPPPRGSPRHGGGSDFDYEERYHRPRVEGDYSRDYGRDYPSSNQYQRYGDGRSRRGDSSEFAPTGPSHHPHNNGYYSPRSSTHRREEEDYNRNNAYNSSSYSPRQETRRRPESYSSPYRDEYARSRRQGGGTDSYSSGNSGGWGQHAPNDSVNASPNGATVSSLSERETEALEEKMMRMAMEQSLNDSQMCLLESPEQPPQQHLPPFSSLSRPGPPPYSSPTSRSHETPRESGFREYIGEDNSHATDPSTAIRLAEIEQEREMLELAIQRSLEESEGSNHEVSPSPGSMSSRNSVGSAGSGASRRSHPPARSMLIADDEDNYGTEDELSAEMLLRTSDSRPNRQRQTRPSQRPVHHDQYYDQQPSRHRGNNYTAGPSVVRQAHPPRRHPLELQQPPPRSTVVQHSHPPRLHPLEQQERRGASHHAHPPRPHPMEQQRSSRSSQL